MGPQKAYDLCVFAQQSHKSDNYTARLPFGSTKKNVKLWRIQLYLNDIGKSSSRKLRWAIYYTLHRMDPQKAY